MTLSDPRKLKFLQLHKKYGELSGFVRLRPLVQLASALLIQPVQNVCMHHWSHVTAARGVVRLVSHLSVLFNVYRC